VRVARRQAGLVRRGVRRFGGGGTVTLFRRHTLADPVAGEVTEALVVAGAHSAGAEEVTLRGGRVRGRMRAGLRVTIGAAPYEVTADADAVGDEVTVPISPPLAAPAGDGEAVAVESARAYELPRLHAQRVERDAAGAVVAVQGGEVVVAALGSPVVPEEGDAVEVDGERVEVTAVERLGTADPPAGWILRRGAA